MTYQWRDLVGSLVGGKYKLTEYLGDTSDHGVFATQTPQGEAVVHLAPAKQAPALLDQWTLATSLIHPSLIRAYEAGKTELKKSSFLYTVTERPDDNLAEVVRARSLTTEEAKPVTESILEAAEYLHAQGFVHGSIDPDNIVAVGDRIKLSIWPVRRGTEADTESDASADLVFIGQTIAEILTQRRSHDAADHLPEPFGAVARACILKQVSAAGALQILRGEVSSQAPASRLKLHKGALAAVFAAVLVILFGVRSFKRQSEPQTSTPAPVTAPMQAARERTAFAAAPAEPALPGKGAWVVVAAIYKDHDLAARRAQSIHEKSNRWQPVVYPPAGQGQRRYMVVLASAGSRKEAQQLLKEARSEGIPRDSYVTRLK